MTLTDDSTVSLTSHCLCKENVFTTQVPRSKLPLKSPICHCWSCRHVTGALYTSDVRWPEPHANVDVSKLKVFSFSPRVNLLFCSTCSTPIFWEMLSEPGNPLAAFTGTLKSEEATPIKFIGQSFVGDTIDGGASLWLQHVNADGSECRRFKVDEDDDRAGNELTRDWPPADEFIGSERKTEGSVPIRCKCKGVDLALHPVDYSGVKEEDLPWNVDPSNHKLWAGFCGCDSCRLQGGVDLWYWAFFDLKHLTGPGGDTTFPKTKHELEALIDKKDPAVGSLAYYASRTKTGVVRFFCGTCSATVFFASDDRPEIVDVSVGLFDAPDGARAESLLSWAFGEVDSKDKVGEGWRVGHFDRVEKEAKEWRSARGYPKS